MIKRIFVCILGLLASCFAVSAPVTEAITLPPGFGIEIYADDLPDARSMAQGEKGTLFVGTRRQGVVYALADRNQDGRPETRYVIAKDLRMPNGVAFYQGDLYVAENHQIVRFDGIENALSDPPDPVPVAELPDRTHHGWRYMRFGPDHKLYVAIGAPCNICDEPGFATIIRMNADGSDRETYARGVRNSVGFDWDPDSGDLWFTDNGRDWLGDDLPPDELNHASQQGQHFGYPYCHGGDLPDPEFGEQRNCAEFRPPAQKLGAHVAGLGMRFYTGRQFPESYRGAIFIAEHGSWNRSSPVGYRVSLVTLKEGKSSSYQPFASGWLDQTGYKHGRPVDLLVLEDGSMLLSDDMAGVIYRISYRE